MFTSDSWNSNLGFCVLKNYQPQKNLRRIDRLTRLTILLPCEQQAAGIPLIYIPAKFSDDRSLFVSNQQSQTTFCDQEKLTDQHVSMGNKQWTVTDLLTWKNDNQTPPKISENTIFCKISKNNILRKKLTCWSRSSTQSLRATRQQTVPDKPGSIYAHDDDSRLARSVARQPPEARHGTISFSQLTSGNVFPLVSLQRMKCSALSYFCASSLMI